MALEFKKISGSTPYLLNSASTAEELTLALEDYMRTGAQIIFQHDGEDCLLAAFKYKTGIESTVFAYFVTPKKKFLKVDTAGGGGLVITENEFTPETDTTLTQSGKPADAKAVGNALGDKANKADLNSFATKVELNKYATKTYVDNAVANASGGGASGVGIIDVDTLPTENIDEKSIYRVKSGLVYYNILGGEERYFRHGTSYIVDELPETGEPCTLDGESLNVIYYERKTNNSYVYIPSSIAPAFGVDEGWYTTAMLMGALGYPWGGIVTSLEDMNEDEVFYFLKKPYYGAYSNGTWTQLSNTSWDDLQDKPFGETKQDLGDTITWDGNIDESKDVVTNTTEFGTGTLRYVKVASSVPTIDDIGSNSIIKFIEIDGNEYVDEEINIDEDNGIIKINSVYAVIVPTDNIESAYVLFPEKGVYFIQVFDADGNLMAYTTSLTIPNYNFGTKITIKKIDEKYLPDTILIKSDSAEIYIVYQENEQTIYEPVLDAIEAAFGIRPNLYIRIVEELPETLEPSNVEGGNVYVYIVESTGVSYTDMGAGTMTLGNAFFDEEGRDKGWIDDINNATETAIYCVRKIVSTKEYIDNAIATAIGNAIGGSY